MNLLCVFAYFRLGLSFEVHFLIEASVISQVLIVWQLLLVGRIGLYQGGRIGGGVKKDV